MPPDGGSTPRDRFDQPLAGSGRPDDHRLTALAQPSRHRWLGHDVHILLLTLTAGLPGVIVSMILVWGGDYTAKVQWTLMLVVVGIWLGFSFAVARARGHAPANDFEPPRCAS